MTNVAVQCNRDRMFKKITNRWNIVTFLFWIICFFLPLMLYFAVSICSVSTAALKSKSHCTSGECCKYGYVKLDASFHEPVSRSQWTLSSPDGRVLPMEGQADGVKEGPSGLHKEGRWSGQ